MRITLLLAAWLLVGAVVSFLVGVFLGKGLRPKKSSTARADFSGRHRRWIVIEAREVIADGPGQALSMPGRRLGVQAMYGGETAAECEHRYETLLWTVPGPPVTQ